MTTEEASLERLRMNDPKVENVILLRPTPNSMWDPHYENTYLQHAVYVRLSDEFEDVMKGNTSVRTIDITNIEGAYTQLLEEWGMMQRVLDVIKTFTDVTALRCKVNEGRYLSILRKVLRCDHLRSLVVDVGMSGLHTLLTEMKSNTSLTSLDIRGEPYFSISYDSCIDPLEDMLLTNTTLTSLSISRVRATNYERISECIGLNSSLRELSLTECGDLSSIHEGIIVNTTLQSLDIDGSLVCTEGFVNVLCVNTTLTRLCLSKSSVLDEYEDPLDLVRALHFNTSLTSLVLGQSYLENADEEVSRTLLINTTLKTLILHNNPSFGSIERISKALLANTTLEYLDIDNCGLDTTPLTEVIIHNTTLRGLLFCQGNSIDSLVSEHPYYVAMSNNTTLCQVDVEDGLMLGGDEFVFVDDTLGGRVSINKYNFPKRVCTLFDMMWKMVLSSKWL